MVRHGYTRKNSFERINDVHENQILKHLHIVFNDAAKEALYGANPYYVSDHKGIASIAFKKDSITK